MSDRLTPISWKHKERIYQKFGYVFSHQEGSHRSYIKKELTQLSKEEIKKLPIKIDGPEQPLIVQLIAKKEIPVGTLQFNKRKLRLSTKEFLDLIQETR